MIDALGLTLLFLRAHTTAHGGKCAGLLEDNGSLVKFLALNIFNKSGDVDADRASCDALRVGTVEASSSFNHSSLFGKTLIYLLIASYTIGGVEFGHLHTRDSCAHLNGCSLA
jgi:hypothetical protein